MAGHSEQTTRHHWSHRHRVSPAIRSSSFAAPHRQQLLDTMWSSIRRLTQQKALSESRVEGDVRTRLDPRHGSLSNKAEGRGNHSADPLIAEDTRSVGFDDSFIQAYQPQYSEDEALDRAKRDTDSLDPAGFRAGTEDNIGPGESRDVEESRDLLHAVASELNQEKMSGGGGEGRKRCPVTLAKELFNGKLRCSKEVASEMVCRLTDSPRYPFKVS